VLYSVRSVERVLNCSSPFLRPWARRWINHWSLWRMAGATTNLRLPSQPQGITAPWPVPNYTARWQRNMRANNLPMVARSPEPTQIYSRNGMSIGSDVFQSSTDRETKRPELSMGPFCVIRFNPTHQLTDTTRPNPIQPTTSNTPKSASLWYNSHWLTLSLYYSLWSVSGTCQIGRKIKFNCLVQTNLI